MAGSTGHSLHAPSMAFSPAGTGQECLLAAGMPQRGQSGSKAQVHSCTECTMSWGSLLESTRLSLCLCLDVQQATQSHHFRNSAPICARSGRERVRNGEASQLCPARPRVLRIWLGRVRFCYHCRGSTFAARDPDTRSTTTSSSAFSVRRHGGGVSGGAPVAWPQGCGEGSQN